MQKVVGSSPITRSSQRAPEMGALVVTGLERPDGVLGEEELPESYRDLTWRSRRWVVSVNPALASMGRSEKLR